MGTTGAYNRGKFSIANGSLSLLTADIRVLLVNSGYIFSAAHNTVADVTFELGGTGYARKQLVNKTLVEDDTNNLARFDADDVLWAGASFTGSGPGGGTPDAAVLYVEGASDATRTLLCSLDLNPKVAPSGVDITLQIGSAGIANLV